MEILVVASIVVNLFALILAIRLLYKTREWRLSFLVAIAALAVLDQWSDLPFTDEFSAASVAAFRIREFADVLVSVMVLLLVFFVGRLIENERRRTEELRVGESRYHSLFNDTPVMLHSEGLKGEIVDVNRHWLKIMGYNREEVLGTDAKNFLTDDSRRQVESVTLPAFLRSGSVSEVPLSLRTKAGRIVDILLSSTAEKNPKGRFVSSRTVMIDVTRQCAAERAQRESEKSAAEARILLLEAVESSPDGIAIYDSSNRLKLYNNALKTGVLSGIADLIEPGVRYETLVRAAVERRLVAVPDGDTQAYVSARLEHHRRGGNTIEVELANGRWMLASNRRLPGGGTMSMRRDISDRKHAELALRESEQRLRTIIENIPGVVFQRILNANGSVDFPFLSSQYGMALGIDTAAAMKDPQVIFRQLHPNDRDGWMAAWRESAKSQTPFDREIRVLWPANDTRWFRIRAIPQRMTDGKTLWDAIGIDVTDEKRASEVRDRMFAALENLSEGVALFGPDDRLVFANRRIVELNEDAGPAVKPGQSFEDIVRASLALGRHPKAAVRKVGKIWQDIRKEMLPDGSVIYLIADITERKRAEEAVRESEDRALLAHEQLMDAIESISEGFVFYDADERLILCNSTYRGMFPQIADLLVPGAGLEDVALAAYERGSLVQATGDAEGWLSKQLQHARTARGTLEYQLSDGRWVISREKRTRGGGVAGIWTDITDLKLAEEAVSRNEQQLSLITENVPALISYVGRDERIRFANSAYRKSRGVPHQHMIGISLKEYWGEDIYARLAGKVKRALAGETVSFESKLTLIGGGTMYVAATYVPHIVDGEVEAFFSLATDITRLVTTRQALRERGQRIHNILENVADGVITIDEKGKIQSFNKAAERMFGYTATEVMDRAVSKLMPAPDRNRHLGFIRDYLNTGKGKTIGVGRREVVALRKDGTTFPASLAVSEIWTGDKRSFISSLLDVTQQEATKEALHARDERLHQLQSELLRVNRAAIIGQLSSSLTHELKQPLAAATFYMQAISQLLKKGSAATDKEITEIIGKVSDQVGRAAAVVNRLGPLFEKGVVERKELNINELVEDAVAVAALELDRGNIDLKTILGRDLPRLVVDRIQVQQVLLNLVRNGAEATRNSKRRALTVRTRIDNSGQIEVSVSDTGAGIPASLRSSIFDPFVTTRTGGTGMGLSVSRTIVEAHGGHIWASPRRGGGTIMHFTLELVVRESARSTTNVRK